MYLYAHAYINWYGYVYIVHIRIVMNVYIYVYIFIHMYIQTYTHSCVLLDSRGEHLVSNCWQLCDAGVEAPVAMEQETTEALLAVLASCLLLLRGFRVRCFQKALGIRLHPPQMTVTFENVVGFCGPVFERSGWCHGGATSPTVQYGVASVSFVSVSPQTGALEAPYAEQGCDLCCEVQTVKA